MKKGFFILVILFAAVELAAQSVKTEAPGKAVTVGEPFRLQFIVENINGIPKFIAPSFKGLIVRGPEKHGGIQSVNGKQVQITNYIYTLVAERPGRFTIEGAKVKINEKEITGNAVTIIAERAIGQQDDYSGGALLPGEDALKKIRENLFIKLFVDRRSCFVGEPIVATFKLFSRLQSKSDIVKNPGFYGFSVHDMIGLDDRVKEIQRINGKDFDVHTIRKVQLYPLQAGVYAIDEMKIENKVEFSQSVVNKKTEQQISEGVLNKDDEEATPPGTKVYDIDLETEPVRVEVKELPVKNRPVDFNGATGGFTIRTSIDKNELDKNEQGFLTVTIEGKGNFTQITPPVIQWPKELEGFEPTVKDFLDKRNVPLNGGRIFKYPFISSTPGKWRIPAVSFSYFSSAAHNYRTVSADSMIVNISSKEFKKTETVPADTGEKKVSIEEANKRVSRIAVSLVAIAIIAALSFWLFKGKRKKEPERNEPVVKPPSLDDFLASVSTDETVPAKEFYKSLQQASWNYLAAKYKLSGSGMNKYSLTATLKQTGNEQSVIDELVNELNFLETSLFTGLEANENSAELISKMLSILSKLK
jgi:hypothetical protein